MNVSRIRNSSIPTVFTTQVIFAAVESSRLIFAVRPNLEHFHPSSELTRRHSSTSSLFYMSLKGSPWLLEG